MSFLEVNSSAGEDPGNVFAFRVTCQGIPPHGAISVGGLESETDVTEYRKGNDPPVVGNVPGLSKHPVLTVTLPDDNLADYYRTWRNNIVHGRSDYRVYTVSALSRDGQQVRWTKTFMYAWLSKDIEADRDANSSDFGTLVVEIAHRGQRRD